jgi:uncharacterized membrane protein
MNTLIIVLRLIHIFGGMFWIGSTLLIDYFVIPSAMATAETGQKFIGHFITMSPIGRAGSISAFLTILAGASLYWIDSNGFTSPWTTSSAGWGFGIGALLAIAGLFFAALHGRHLFLFAETASQIAGRATPPELEKLQIAHKRLRISGRLVTALLLLALACMATARYWRF